MFSLLRVGKLDRKVKETTMNHLGAYDYLRILSIILGLISLFYLGRRFKRYGTNYTSYLRDVWLLLVGFLVLVVEGSAEQLLTNVQGGPRTVLTFLLMLVAVRVTSSKDTVFLEGWSKANEK